MIPWLLNKIINDVSAVFLTQGTHFIDYLTRIHGSISLSKQWLVDRHPTKKT
jgi:hypothetical protein